MSLSKQVHAFSIGTDAFYDEKEQYYHQRLLKLYKARSEYKKEEKKQNKAVWWQESKKWRKKAINRVLAREKEKLSNILDERAKDRTPRELNPNSLKEKNVILNHNFSKEIVGEIKIINENNYVFFEGKELIVGTSCF